jgi:hypothetical protein
MTDKLGADCKEMRHECCAELAEAHIYLDECYVNDYPNAGADSLRTRIAHVVGLLTECRAENREGFAMLQEMRDLLIDAIPAKLGDVAGMIRWHERCNALLAQLKRLS